MDGIDFIAIAAGLGVAIVLSGLVGAIFGVAVVLDADQPDDEAKMEAHFEAQLRRPALLVQLSLLTLLVTLLSGAVTALLAPQAPYLNAAIVGAVGTIAGLLLPSPGFPAALRWIMSLATLPTTLAGAWALVLFTG